MKTQLVTGKLFHLTWIARPDLKYFKQWCTQGFCSGGGVQQIQLRTEDRENGDLGPVAP